MIVMHYYDFKNSLKNEFLSIQNWLHNKILLIDKTDFW